MRNGIILEGVLACVAGVGFCILFVIGVTVEGRKIVLDTVGKTLDKEVPSARDGVRKRNMPPDMCLNRSDPSTEQR